MNDQLKGILITTLGVLLVTPDSLFVRLIGGDPYITAFWRGLLSGGAVLIYVLLFQGTGAIMAVLRTGWVGAGYMVLIIRGKCCFHLCRDARVRHDFRMDDLGRTGQPAHDLDNTRRGCWCWHHRLWIGVITDRPLGRRSLRALCRGGLCAGADVGAAGQRHLNDPCDPHCLYRIGVGHLVVHRSNRNIRPKPHPVRRPRIVRSDGHVFPNPRPAPDQRVRGIVAGAFGIRACANIGLGHHRGTSRCLGLGGWYCRDWRPVSV